MVDTTTLELINSPVRQRANEKRAYRIRTLEGMTPTTPTISVFDVTTGEPGSAAGGTTEGSPTVSGRVITTCLIKSLVSGKIYRVDVQFNSGDEVIIRHFRVECE